jgi:hypothetical protein
MAAPEVFEVFFLSDANASHSSSLPPSSTDLSSSKAFL